MGDVRELIRREPSPAEHAAIRDLWKRHSIAEDKRDLPGLLATLTDDCVYELVQTGHRWDGHEGAAGFYLGLLGAFPDIDFQLTSIVIGPQGVSEEARVTGTHEGEWLGIPPTGEQLAWQGTIFFPWDRDRGLFRGERGYTAGLAAPRRRPQLRGGLPAPRLTAARAARRERSRCHRDGCGGRSGRSRHAGPPRSAASRSSRACRRA